MRKPTLALVVAALLAASTLVSCSSTFRNCETSRKHTIRRNTCHAFDRSRTFENVSRISSQTGPQQRQGDQ